MFNYSDYENSGDESSLDDAYGAHSSDDEFEATSSKRTSGKRKSVAPKTSKVSTTKAGVKSRIPEIARVASTATDFVQSQQAEEKLSNVDQSVLGKIKKAMELAQHAGTGEAEAKAALRVASALMAKINITQADLIAQETAAEKSSRGGMSTVEIVPNPDCRTRGKNSEGPSIVQNKDWHNRCAYAIDAFFDVKSFSTQDFDPPKLTWTFYGIAENTTAAVYAFEMVHNTITTWSYENANLKGRVAMNSYRIGVAEGLLQTAEKERQKEEQRAIENEKKMLADRVAKEKEERQRELDRLKNPKIEEVEEVVIKEETRGNVKLEEIEDPDLTVVQPSPVSPDDDSDNEDNGFNVDVVPDFQANDADDVGDNVEDFIKGLAARQRQQPKPEPSPSPSPPLKKEEAAEEEVPIWGSSTQLITFRKNAESIADEFLKSNKIKLGAARKRKGPKLDKAAYHRGQKDSEKIDVKRRRLE